MRRNKVIKRYNLGSFVSNSNNVMKVTNAASQITGNGVLSSAASGAALGSIFPGAGSIIGAGAGLLTGAIGSIFGGRRRRRRQRELINQQNALHQTAATEQLEAGVTTENDNPLGVYQDGGDVGDGLVKIKNSADNTRNNLPTSHIPKFNKTGHIQNKGNIKGKIGLNLAEGNYPLINPLLELLDGLGLVRGGGIDNEDLHGDLQDLYRHYFQQPLENNILRYSNFKPTNAKNPNQNYVSIDSDDFKEAIIDSVNSELWLLRRDSIRSGKRTPKWSKGTVDGYESKAASIGEFYASEGSDEHGDYISYYDIFDSGLGKNLSPDEALGFSKSFELYDRLYVTKDDEGYYVLREDQPKYVPHDDKLQENLMKLLKGNKFQDGGDVFPNIINIEKGETQVDVASGKILRKYDGINPETGGLYQEHNEEGEDPIDNLVTAEEGTFIITKEASKKYREAVKNNDKITQETIMQNIRNKKKSLTGVYQDGGRVRRLNNFRLPDIVNPAIGTSLLGTDPNRAPIDTFGSPSASTSVTGYTPEAALSMVPSNVMESGTPRSSNLARNIETGLGYATQLLPGVANLIQGASSPNYMTPNRVGVNPTNRQAILNSLPTEVSANPAVNNARAARYNMMRDIDRNTSDANIRRALKTGTASALINQENEAYYNNQILNNQIKAQRAGILSGLEQMDTQREMFNAQQMMNINHTNRMMDLAKRQQSNTGLSQIARGIQNRIDSRVKDRAGDQMLDVMSQIAPEAAFLFNQFKRR